MLQKILVVPNQLCLKSGPSTKKKGSAMVNHGGHRSVETENLKGLSFENKIYNKENESVSVTGTVRNHS